jgi:hypothetical protein
MTLLAFSFFMFNLSRNGFIVRLSISISICFIFHSQARIIDQFNAKTSAYATVTVNNPDVSSTAAVTAVANHVTSALAVAVAAGDVNACAQLRIDHII